MNKNFKRCTKCVLPENFLGADFDENGVCRYCREYHPRIYPGKDQLKNKICKLKSDNTNYDKKNDCVVGFSGGRDSTYILWYAVKKLGLKCIAFCLDNGFMPELTKQNIREVTSKLNVPIVIQKHNYLTKHINRSLSAFLYKPHPAMVGMLCSGCRL